MKYFLFLVPILFITCTQEKINPAYDASLFWKEHHKQTWDSLTTANQLSGIWDWVYQSCCPEGIMKHQDTSGSGIYVVFGHSDIQVYEKNTLKETATWSVYFRENEQTYMLATNPPISFLHGRILFYKEYVLFNNSYIDGENNYFKKRN
ncbi:MAG: hypothetical protein OEY34_08065 [Cyclobacteriaceae bacterium]|nr:hypothetical protein [Cyclobacteriaceae bacterium]